VAACANVVVSKRAFIAITSRRRSRSRTGKDDIVHGSVASEREGAVQGYQGEPVERRQGDAEHPRDSRQRAVRVERRQVLRAHAQRRGDPRQARRGCPLSGEGERAAIVAQVARIAN